MIILNHLQSKFKNISETCCLALTYLSLVYWTVINLDNDELETKVVSTLMKALDDRSLLEDDASVVDADKFIKYCTGIYNSLEESKCLSLGKPVDARIIEVV